MLSKERTESCSIWTQMHTDAYTDTQTDAQTHTHSILWLALACEQDVGGISAPTHLFAAHYLGKMTHIPDKGTEYWLHPHSCGLASLHQATERHCEVELLWQSLGLGNIYGITRHKLLGTANWNHQQTLWRKYAGHETTWERRKLALLCFVIKCP